MRQFGEPTPRTARPTWIGVPALVLVLLGVLVLADAQSRQDLSRELLDTGIETVADAVQVEVTGGAGRPAINEVRVDLTAAGADRIRTTLHDIVDDRQGMPEGIQQPAPGTRYAMPLHLVYRQSDPSTVLALKDAQEWLDDKDAPRLGQGLIGAGLALVVLAALLLTIGARRRGLAWWQWYAEPLARHRK
ncbi:hypothetical protein E1218_09740 [Kribbella turkmenica]|uniref:Uncharacterized protein n=1 Tax=Kribbella turkmenica TaxID=2530375 RepID=A0A4R4XAR1_9ACTN|nr:hypothetical protein [Kribbella turkmenica]TDD27660.1 hypothetical protein E1218_09740 [Kribbella turkmenica]